MVHDCACSAAVRTSICSEQMSLEIPPEKATTVSNLKSGIASNRPGWVFWILILLAFLGFGQHCLGSFDGRGSVKKSEAASCAVSVGLLASRILSCWILYGEVSLFFFLSCHLCVRSGLGLAVRVPPKLLIVHDCSWYGPSVVPSFGA